ncbi:hypothetical protein TeGR_g3734, partial [Tetraparma gracilis]
MRSSAAPLPPPRPSAALSVPPGGAAAVSEAAYKSAPLSVPPGGAAAVSEAAYKSAILRTVLCMASAGLFGLALIPLRGRKTSLEFFSGYLIEQALSVDNLFVFILLFDYFKVPPALQPRVLAWGIWGAIGMRGAMILVGAAALKRARGVLLCFAAVLFASGVKLFAESFVGAEEEGELENNFIMKTANYLVPSTPKYDGGKFFTTVKGRRLATPLLTCLVCIELSDFVFAVDSIPAVLAITKDPVIVYASNIFA